MKLSGDLSTPFCDICYQNTFLEILSKNNCHYIISKCKKCDKNEEVSFINFFSTKSQVKKEIISCSIHKDEPYNFYCICCKCNGCQKCEIFHKNHKKMIFTEIINEQRENQIKESIAQANKNVFEINKELKNILISSLTKQLNLIQNKINKLEKTYHSYSSINENLLNFITVIHRDYLKYKPHLNYQIISNLLTNAKFNLKQYFLSSLWERNINQEASNFISYLNSSQILTIKPECKISTQLEQVGRIELIHLSNLIYITSDNKIAVYSQVTNLISIYDPYSFESVKVFQIEPYASKIFTCK